MSRVTEIRYVGYAVTDLETERSFYTDTWGLTQVSDKRIHKTMCYTARPTIMAIIGFGWIRGLIRLK